MGIASVESIIKVQTVTRMPHTPEFVEGITNLRGKVLPVVDLRRRFGLETREADKNSRIIATSVNGMESGFLF